MDDIVAFVRARLNEDEAAANANDGAQWPDISGDDDFGYRHWHDQDGYLIAYSDSIDEPLVQHMSRHDPARVLVQVTVMRRVVDEYERSQLGADVHPGPDTHAVARRLEQVVAQLAAIWHEHSDYDPAWAPD